MRGQICKYIGCENEQQHDCRACSKCKHKYAGKEKPPSSVKANKKWRNIVAPDPEEKNVGFVRYEYREDYKKIIAEARDKLPKPQYIDENLNYIPKEDGFKKYSRVTELDTVGKIKLPWDK